MIQWAPFSPKALDFLTNSDARVNILHGSVRSSKTINCTVRWLSYIVDGPPGDLAMLGKTTATLQRNVLNDLFDIVGPKNYKWINRQQGELQLFGRRIYCFGANNEDAESKIRGATFAGAYCDEANLYPQSVFNQLMARMSIKGAKCFCNCNPDSPYHWFYTDYIQNPTIKDKKVWKFLMDDNLSLDQDYIESLKQMYTGVWYERMILGKWVAAEGVVYKDFNREKHYIKDTEGIQFKKFFAGVDYGWEHYGAIVVVGLDIYNNYYLVEEHAHQHKDIDQWCSIGKDIIKRYGNINFYCDHARPDYVNKMRVAGIRAIEAKKDVTAGISEVATLFKTNRLFIVESKAKKFNEEIYNYVWKQGKDEPIKEGDDVLDILLNCRV